MMLERSILVRIDGHKCYPGVLSDCSLNASYDRLSFLTWSRVWLEAAKHEANHRALVAEPYFFGRRDREFYTIPREERAKVYVKVPSRRE